MLSSGPELSEPEVRYLGDVQRLTLNPDDVLVLTLAEQHVSDELARRIRESLTLALGADRKVLVLPRDMKIGVLGLESKLSDT